MVRTRTKSTAKTVEARVQENFAPSVIEELVAAHGALGKALRRAEAEVKDRGMRGNLTLMRAPLSAVGQYIKNLQPKKA